MTDYGKLRRTYLVGQGAAVYDENNMLRVAFCLEAVDTENQSMTLASDDNKSAPQIFDLRTGQLQRLLNGEVELSPGRWRNARENRAVIYIRAPKAWRIVRREYVKNRNR